jgi:uncharacterized protein
MLDLLRRTFVPRGVFLGASEGPALDALAALAPIAAGKTAIDGLPAAYLCEGGTCRLPTTEPAVLGEQLAALR